MSYHCYYYCDNNKKEREYYLLKDLNELSDWVFGQLKGADLWVTYIVRADKNCWIDT